jgi:hypothetical protein
MGRLKVRLLCGTLLPLAAGALLVMLLGGLLVRRQVW